YDRYGTPYLLALELSKELTALVWLAGPLSGLIVQPLIGAWSDHCTSKLGRRRPFIIIGGVLVCVSLLSVAHAQTIAGWVTAEETLRKKVSIGVAIFSFYFLDFCLNAVQACCRSLFLDVFPISQQDTANAFGSNLGNLTNVLGYFIGYVDLVKHFPMLGSSQFQVLCVVGVLVFTASMTVTCLTVREEPLSADEAAMTRAEPWFQVFVYVWRALGRLPPSVQKLCNAQFFVWMGWFPFLFYSSTWVAEIYFETHDRSSWDESTRAGSFALLMYAVVSVVSGTVFPYLTSRGYLSLKNTYTLAHSIFAAAMLSTFFVHHVAGATMILAVVGISWATLMWIPFALIGEYLVMEQQERDQRFYYAAERSLLEPGETYDAGMVLGVHNLYVVVPQFVVALVVAVIFSLVQKQQHESHDLSTSVAWVLRFGGLMALIAVALSRRIVDVGCGK
ncbi:major facilitator superfamily domain-containing protein, partial [Dichotomocladium elegans]